MIQDDIGDVDCVDTGIKIRPRQPLALCLAAVASLINRSIHLQLTSDAACEFAACNRATYLDSYHCFAIGHVGRLCGLDRNLGLRSGR